MSSLESFLLESSLLGSPLLGSTLLGPSLLGVPFVEAFGSLMPPRPFRGRAETVPHKTSTRPCIRRKLRFCLMVSLMRVLGYCGKALWGSCADFFR